MKTFARLTFTLMFLLSLSACSPSEQVIQTAMAQTQDAIPTETSISYSQINLDNMIIQAGDLPSTWESGQIEYSWPEDMGLTMYSKPENLILLNFKEKADSFNLPNFSMIALYQEEQKAKESYDDIASQLGLKDAVTIGDMGGILHYTQTESGTTITITLKGTIVAFIRCNALVFIRAFEIEDDQIIAYGQRIDKRLEPLACR